MVVAPSLFENLCVEFDLDCEVGPVNCSGCRWASWWAVRRRDTGTRIHWPVIELTTALLGRAENQGSCPSSRLGWRTGTCTARSKPRYASLRRGGTAARSSQLHVSQLDWSSRLDTIPKHS